MGRRSGVGVVIIAVLALAGGSLAPMQGMYNLGSGGDARVGLFEEPSPWTDSFDDMSHVYVPEGGLVNVEVAGGEARLKAGSTEGWIASEAITCPIGFRYDLVLLEADTAGSSQVQISILNASKESSEIGFANETIPPHVKVKATNHSINDVSSYGYPAIRIQVNLVASGADRPRLLAWSLHFVGLDEWCDEFLDFGKMTSHRGLNITGDALEVNLTGGRGASDYEPYPPIAGPTGTTLLSLLYPSTNRTGYEDFTNLSEYGYNCAVFEDLNGDCLLDLVTMVYLTSGFMGIQIFWGSSSDTYSYSDTDEIAVDYPQMLLRGISMATAGMISLSHGIPLVPHMG